VTERKREEHDAKSVNETCEAKKGRSDTNLTSVNFTNEGRMKRTLDNVNSSLCKMGSKDADSGFRTLMPC
jgi:hypothetical protein